jgi:hypothetical protein
MTHRLTTDALIRLVAGLPDGGLLVVAKKDGQVYLLAAGDPARVAAALGKRENTEPPAGGKG